MSVSCAHLPLPLPLLARWECLHPQFIWSATTIFEPTCSPIPPSRTRRPSPSSPRFSPARLLGHSPRRSFPRLSSSGLGSKRSPGRGSRHPQFGASSSSSRRSPAPTASGEFGGDLEQRSGGMYPSAGSIGRATRFSKAISSLARAGRKTSTGMDLVEGGSVKENGQERSLRGLEVERCVLNNQQSETTQEDESTDLSSRHSPRQLAAFITTPFDVLKTRRQVFTLPSPPLPGSLPPSGSIVPPANVATHTFPLLLHIVRTEGLAALFAGLVPRLAKVAPACAIMVSCYEGVGRWLGGDD